MMKSCGRVQVLSSHLEGGNAGRASAARSERMGRFVAEYHSQGDHRAGTDVDEANAVWLASKIRDVGAEPTLVRFPIIRRSILSAALTLTDAAGSLRVLDGLPAFDCAEYTPVDGLVGTLGGVGSGADFLLCDYQGAQLPEIEGRRSGEFKGIVAVHCPPAPPATGCAGGLAAANAEAFEHPFGPPLLLVDSRHRALLAAAAAGGRLVRLCCCMSPSESEEESSGANATGVNVEVEVPGTDPSLPPVLVITPRSGWWGCAVERGAALAAWLELVGAAAAAASAEASAYAARPARTVLFTANTGHELGHLGNREFGRRRPGFVKRAHLCLHLGANWGAASAMRSPMAASAASPSTAASSFVAQVSGPDTRELLLRALGETALHEPAGVLVASEHGRPVGEAREIFDAGGRFVSFIGVEFAEFHTRGDLPAKCDLGALGRMVEGMGHILRSACGDSSHD